MFITQKQASVFYTKLKIKGRNWCDLKRRLLLLALIMVVVFAINEQAFGLEEGTTAQQQQFMGALALAGFVGIYSVFIYTRKSSLVYLK